MGQAFSIPEAISTLFDRLTRDSRLILVLGAAWFAVASLLGVVITAEPVPFVSQVGAAAIQAFFAAALTYAAVGDYAPSPSEAANVAGRAYWPVLGVTLLTGLATAIGLLLLIIPGIAVSLLFGLSIPVMMAERPTVIEAMRRSATLVWPSIWLVLFFAIVVGLPAFIVVAIVVTIVESASSALAFGLTQAAAGIISVYASAAVYLVITNNKADTISGTFE